MLPLLFALSFVVAVCHGAPSPVANYEMLLGGKGLSVPLTMKWKVGGLPKSCKEILADDAEAHSGEYYIAIGRKFVLVYCEMGLNGGGYTFLHPTAFSTITDDAIQKIFTDRTSFLMRTLRTDSRQTVSVLKQLDNFAGEELKLGLDQHDGYQTPINKLGTYLFFGFIPVTLARARTTQGIKVNDKEVAFSNCDANGNSHFVLSPNFAEIAPTNTGSTTATCQKFFTLGHKNPSGRLMPQDYFMFAEMHFGGCGCLTTTNTVEGTVVATSIGFR